jgi:hypothetical protein
MKDFKVCLLIPLLCSITACVSIEDKWESALSTNTITGYNTFLIENPNATFTGEAHLKIMALRWKEAQAANTLDSYNQFLKTYPNGTFSDKARMEIMHIDWLYAEDLNTFESYKAFLQKHPEGDLSPRARSKIMEIDWESTIKENSIEAYEKFLSRHPVGKHTMESYQYLKTQYANRDWQITQSLDSPKAYTSFLIKHPRSEHALQAYKRIKESENPALTEFRKLVVKQIKKERLGDEDIIPIFAVFPTDEPSYFVVKKSNVIFYKCNDHNVIPYHQAARLPLVHTAEPFEGLVLFVNQKDLKTPKLAGQKLFWLLSPLYNLYRLKMLRETNDEYSVLWPFGKDGEYLHEVLINTLESQPYHMLPESEQEPAIQKLENDISMVAKNNSGQTEKIAANQLLLYLKTEKHQTPSVRIDIDAEFFSQNKHIDCEDRHGLDDIHNIVDKTVFSCINFYKTQKPNPDLLITIKMKGQAELALYGHKYKLFTGAKTTGTIKVEMPDVASGTEAFEGYRPSQSGVLKNDFIISRNENPCLAPYASALNASNFKEALETAVSVIVGDRFLKNNEL